MRLIVGTRNEGKFGAVREEILGHSRFIMADIANIDAPSGVPAQPIGFEEIYLGARNRALHAFTRDNTNQGVMPDYSIGIEGGVIQITPSDFHNVTCCVIYNGRLTYSGLSSSFPLPKQLGDCVILERLELDKAAYRLGITKSERVGHKGGVSEVISNGSLNRSIFVREAVRNALVPILNNTHYQLP